MTRSAAPDHLRLLVLVARRFPAGRAAGAPSYSGRTTASWTPPVTPPELTRPPVPMHGHVTSSYDSVALGTPFALALLDPRTSRHGELLDAVDDGIATAARVVSPVPYDPDGQRRDG